MLHKDLSKRKVILSMRRKKFDQINQMSGVWNMSDSEIPIEDTELLKVNKISD